MVSRRHGTVLLVGGVGMWPGLFAKLSADLRSDLPEVAVIDHSRVGHDGRRPAACMSELIGDVRVAIDRAGPPVTMYGELGGATVAVALALDPPVGLDGVVAHEPYLGRLEPDLHETVLDAAAEMSAAGPSGAVGYLRHRLGVEAWESLPDAARQFAADHAAAIAAEVVQIAAWEPDPDLRLRIPVLTTVGEASPRMCRRVARILRHAGARTDMTRGGHLASVDDPAAIVAAIRCLHAA